MTSAKGAAPFHARHPLEADSISLNTIVRHAVRVPDPLVFSVRSRTVANTLSMALVVRRCRQCSAGKSYVGSSVRSFVRHSVALGYFAWKVLDCEKTRVRLSSRPSCDR